MNTKTNNLIDDVLQEINEVMHQVDQKQIDQVADIITKNKRIFVLGSGRSGFMAKSFAMRLMHLGYQVYVIGETITPSIEKGDVLVSVSGSGKTDSVVKLTQKAQILGVKIVVVTSNKKSPLTKAANQVMIVPGATKNGDGIKSIQLLSTLFDQSVHIVLDILCLKLSKREKVTNIDAKAEHNNME